MGTMQRLSKKLPTDSDIAEKYFSLISTINDLQLTMREVQLLGYMATCFPGSITDQVHKEEFCKRFSTTSPTINNIVSRLKRLGILVKVNNRIVIVPVLSLDFKKDVLLQIKLERNGIFE
jgi:hypothetical protein